MTGEVLFNYHIRVWKMQIAMLSDAFCLVELKFQQDAGMLADEIFGLLQQSIDEYNSIQTSIQRQLRLVGGDLIVMELCTRDVGQVGTDQVELSHYCFEQVTLHEEHTLLTVMLLDIGFGNLQRRMGNITGDDLQICVIYSQCQTDTSAARADIGDHSMFLPFLEDMQRILYQQFRLGAWDEHIWRDL